MSKSAIRVSVTPEKPLMVYDGDCNFCRCWIARWQEITGDRLDYLPSADPQVTAYFPEIPAADFQKSIHLIEPDGSVFTGAEAVFRSLNRQRLYDRIPGLAPVSEFLYRLVARNRPIFSALTRWLWGDHVGRPTHYLPRWLFLRALGIIYLIAIISLWTQLEGLTGSNGIQPANQLIQSIRQQADQRQIGPMRYWYVPTFCWLNASDAFLHAHCAVGVLAAALLIAGVAPVPSLILLWLIYLSLATIGDVFLGYQWDALLLETGLLAIFIAPLRLLPGISRERPPSRIALWMLRLLLFKLMFCSGVVKLSSGDPTWRNLTALTVHYETQPLSTWTAWYAHQLPVWFHKFSCAAMFGVELAAPFLIFAPRRLRFAGCAVLIAFQLLIIATGNYCFFNGLTVALCFLLLDDAYCSAVRIGRFLPALPPATAAATRRWRAWLLSPFAAVYLLLSTVLIVGTFRTPIRWHDWVTTLHRRLAPLRSINGYGLFAVMTTSRPEIIIEGSLDGQLWLPYEFKHKPGDPRSRPQFTAPHQPRLDWQMWFEALHTLQPRPQPSPWFMNFCARLLQGQPEVLALLKTNPFPAAPPRYLRAVVYDYRFTDFAARRATREWWRREAKALYCPVLSLQQP